MSFLSSFLRYFLFELDPVGDNFLVEEATKSPPTSQDTTTMAASASKYKYTDIIFEIKGKIGIIKVLNGAIQTENEPLSNDTSSTGPSHSMLLVADCCLTFAPP